MQKYTPTENISIESKKREASSKILVTGASGFIGSRVVSRLLQLNSSSLSPKENYEIVCLTRDKESLRGLYDGYKETVRIVEADASDYSQLVKALKGVTIAFYLIHSMGGTSKEWKKFAQRDRSAAKNFADAATKCGVERIIYLGGLTQGDNEEDFFELSEHMRSRKEVGDILRSSKAKVTFFHAAVILGQAGGSFQMLEYLVKRLPVMVCPKWVLTKSQPISVDDVVEYLVKSINVKETEGRDFDIGGTEVLTYLDMMKLYAVMLNKSIRIIIVPFLTPRLSSYWVDLITPVKASLARPLIDSLKHEATVRDDSIKKLVPIKLKTFEEAVRAAEAEEKAKRKDKGQQRISHSFNNKLLIASLLAMAVIGSTYYMLDARPEVFQTSWLVLSGLWFFFIAFSLFFVYNGARLGAITSGIIGWITLTFWLVDNIYTISGNSLIATSPDLTMTIRNFVGAVVASVVVATSHDVYHKVRLHGI
jgi:uncharacterized protein YbjT (DUF2867 family)